MTENVIETFDLTKIYKLKGQKKALIALNNVNISIKERQIFGLLGPNGAGKTTMIQILTTLKQPTSGYATIDGYNIITNPKQAKKRVALMMGGSMLYYRITAYKNLKYFCKIYNVSNYKEKIFRMAEEFGLEKWLNQYVENFSSGMKMKLALLRTILLERKILFLDEPTLGLDVKSKDNIVDIIKKLDQTIFLTSHDMGVVEQLCNRIAFIDKGNIIKIGTKEELKNLMHTEIKIEVFINDNKNQLKSELNNNNFIKEIIDMNNGFIISIKERNNFPNLLSILSKYNVTKINEQEINLSDLFRKFL